MDSSPQIRSSLKYAVVCSSNQNRSMEAHNIFSKKGLNVNSYGTGKEVKLPGSSLQTPNVYDFNNPEHTYEYMYKDLSNKDRQLYTSNGILHMLDRNRRIKLKPERFQDSKNQFDVIFTAEERVFDQVIEDLESREKELNQPVHIINVDIADNHEDATLGAFLIYELALQLEKTDDMENEIDEILQEYESKINRPILHSISFY